MKNNHLLLRDLKIEESSLLLSFRERFYKMIHEDSDDEIDFTDISKIYKIVTDSPVFEYEYSGYLRQRGECVSGPS